MGGIVVAILAFFVILYYWSSKNDDIWEDETFKRHRHGETDEP